MKPPSDNRRSMMEEGKVFAKGGMNDEIRFCFNISLRNPNFVVSDLIATAQSLGVFMRFEDETLRVGIAPTNTFLVLLFHSEEDARLFSSRSIVTKTVSRLLFDSPTFEEILSFAETYTHNINEGTYSIKIDTFGRKAPSNDRLNYINQIIQSLRLTTKVDLKNPATKITLFIRLIPEQVSEVKTERYYLGYHFCEGAFDFPDKYTLKDRPFINKTSMESSVALLACNQGLCKPGKIVFDPFCGSGSLLIAAASLGSHVIGSDFDLKSMTQQGPEQKEGVSIPSNFQKYGLLNRFIGLIQLDFLSDNLRLSKMPPFDAIITDPPYGIREKIRTDAPTPLLPLLLRLYEVSAKILKFGGRLVFWLPTGYDFDPNKDLPKHRSLKLISDCQQDLMTRYCRHLITLEKIHYSSNDQEDIESKVEFEIADQSFLRVRQLVFSERSNPDGFLRKESRSDRRKQKKSERKPKDKETEPIKP